MIIATNNKIVFINRKPKKEQEEKAEQPKAEVVKEEKTRKRVYRP